MTDTAISPLRVRMIEDMTVRGFTASTQRGYISAVTAYCQSRSKKGPRSSRHPGRFVTLINPRRR